MSKHVRMTSIGRRTRTIGAMLLLVGAITASTATAAQAGSNEAITVKGGQATFQHYGEILTATDTRKDGRCITAVLKYIGAGPNAPVVYEKVEACGRGDVERENMNLRERASVSLQVCYTGGGKRDKCSGWQEATA